MWAILPVKRFPRAKTRLANLLTSSQRAMLAREMLLDVLDALTQSGCFERFCLVSAEPEVAEIARTYGAEVLPEPEPGGIAAAATAGLRYATAEAACGALIVPADIPVATAGEFRRLIAVAGTGAALVPAHRDGGTNGVVVPAGTPLALQFGGNSLRRHVDAFRALGEEPTIVHSELIGFDIDEPDDLRRLLESDVSTSRTARFLHREVAAGWKLPVDQDSNRIEAA